MIWVLGKGMEMRSWGSFVSPCKSLIITPVPKPKIRINTQDQCVMRLCVFINYQIGTYTLSIYLNLFVIYLLLTKKKHIYKSKFLQTKNYSLPVTNSHALSHVNSNQHKKILK